MVLGTVFESVTLPPESCHGSAPDSRSLLFCSWGGQQQAVCKAIQGTPKHFFKLHTVSRLKCFAFAFCIFGCEKEKVPDCTPSMLSRRFCLIKSSRLQSTLWASAKSVHVGVRGRLRVSMGQRDRGHRTEARRPQQCTLFGRLVHPVRSTGFPASC